MKNITKNLSFLHDSRCTSHSRWFWLSYLLNAEFYEGVFDFILILVDNAVDLGVRDGITNEGYLELKWDKPSFEQLDTTCPLVAITKILMVLPNLIGADLG